MAGVSDLAMRILIGAEDRTGPAFKHAKDGIQSISDSLARVETLAKRFLDIRLFAGMVQDGVSLNDTYKEIQGKLNQIVGESGNLAAVQERLFRVAQSTGSEFKGTVDLYARGAEALRKVNDGQELAAKLAETVNLSFKAQRTNTAEAASTVGQLTQAIGTGTVTWEDFGNVAQSNLLLANVAAKNLGYDGINGLKAAISDGKITGEQMARAIVAGFDEIKARADQMPIGVAQSMTLINNALIKFSGESNNVNTAAKAMSGALQFVAEHMNAIANTALVLAEIYAVRLTAGLVASSKATYSAAVASRAKAAADREAAAAASATLAQDIRRAEVETRHSLNLIKEAQLQRSLATTEQQRVQAIKQLDAAYKVHAANVALLQTKHGELNAVVGATGGKATLAARGIALLSGAISGLMALPLITTVADWLLKFDLFYTASMRMQEGLVIVLTGMKALADGMSMSDRMAQIRAIHQEFNQLIANHGTAAKQSAVDVGQAEAEKVKATEEAAQKQAAAFAKVQVATKALTAQIDADAKTQTAAIQQALAERLAAIDASNQLDAQKDAARVQAKLAATAQEMALQQIATQAKIQLIEQEYARELQQAQGHADRLKEIETSKRQAKLSVYQGLAEFYTQEVDRLTQVYAQESAAYAQARQSIEQLATTHQQRMLELERMGMTDRQKVRSEEIEFNKTVAALKAEIAKGDQANQTTVNDLMARAKTLQGEITQATVQAAETQGQKSSAIYAAKQRELKLYELEKGLLEANAKAHQDAANKTQQSLEGSKQKLAETKGLLDQITAQLAKEYKLTIGIDPASLNQTQQAIAELVKPETKVITIKTENAGNGDAAPAQATGGPAGQPTNEPWRFSTGGWARMAGLLSGYGGGDRRKALLEDGEFIVRKEAVQKLGVPFLQAVNQGEVPVMRAGGGVVDDAVQKDALENIKKLLYRFRTAALQQYNGFGSPIAKGNSRFALREAQRALEKQLQPWLELARPDGGTMAQIKEAVAKLPGGYSNRPLLSGEHLWGPETIALREKSRQESIVYSAAIGKIGSVDTAKNNLERKVYSIPQIPTLQASPTPSAPPSKTITVEFKAPGGAGVTASFGSDADVSKMLDVLKNAGARVGV